MSNDLSVLLRFWDAVEEIDVDFRDSYGDPTILNFRLDRNKKISHDEIEELKNIIVNYLNKIGGVIKSYAEFSDYGYLEIYLY
jgi:hypothetical protein